MRTVVFINAHSKRGSRSLPIVREYFATHHTFAVIDFIVVDELSGFQAALDKLGSHKDAECVIIGGGDGTIMTALNTLKDHKDILYGFLPLGTTNVFARNLGLPLTIRKV